jgi:hypothetical protein
VWTPLVQESGFGWECGFWKSGYELMSAMTLAQRIEHDLKSNGGEYVIRNNGPSKKSGVWEAFGIVATLLLGSRDALPSHGVKPT